MSRRREVAYSCDPSSTVDGGRESKDDVSVVCEGSPTIQVLPSGWSFTDFISLKSKSSLGREVRDCL